ncbi:hypothetical protein [Pedobacter antarcticus]|uniref:hypothetical protein n=1 Tax=Pedobacter antarcticus TaxID=34086 RepID=UPI00292EBD91|nr:hypothetical protein [Pedobacter antarcticus]
MTKSILTLIALTISTYTIKAQVKKQQVKPSEQSIIAAKSKKWFKEVYVASTFKDPYSYKLMKFEIFPVSFATEAESVRDRSKDEMNYAKEKLAKIDTSSADSKYQIHNSELKILKTKLDESEKKYGSITKDPNNVLSQYNNKFMELHYDTAGLYKASEIIRINSGLLKSIENVNSKKTMYYYIDIDCYGANSFGNKVLGSYFFKFNKDGLVGDVTKRD